MAYNFLRTGKGQLATRDLLMAEDLKQISDLLRQARAGSDRAAREIVEHYGPYILKVVRQRLNKKLRSKFDSVDFVQSVWASFFSIPPQRYQFEEPEDLIAFLEQLARHKVVEEVRQRLRGQKRDVGREILLTHPNLVKESDLTGRGSPTPSQVAMAEEEWQRALAGQASHHQHVMESFRGGRSPKQIAEELGISEKTVRRVIRRLRLGFAS
jgi:RNA polymerase sigma-70 factor (ECF subfamily)